MPPAVCFNPQYDPANVLMLNAEDDVETVIQPRLEAAGADLSRVHFTNEAPGCDDQPRPLVLPQDLEALEEHITTRGVKLVTIDPLFGFTGETNTNSDPRSPSYLTSP